MSLTIQQFKVTNTTTGHTSQSGRRTSTQLATVLATKSISDGLADQTQVPGTPDAITSGALQTTAHMSSTYIELTRTNGDNGPDKLLAMTKLRVTFVGGTSSADNMILYAFAPLATTTPVNLMWRVLIANCSQQTAGDYFDIELSEPGNKYLTLLLINDAWSSRTIVNESLKLCSVPGNLTYYCLNQTYSSEDVGDAHAICMQGYSSTCGAQTRVCVAFEDWTMATTDKDYNDVVLSIQDVFLDDVMENDTIVT